MPLILIAIIVTLRPQFCVHFFITIMTQFDMISFTLLCIIYVVIKLNQFTCIEECGANACHLDLIGYTVYTV